MIAIACDHGGYDLKLEIIRYLKDENIELFRLCKKVIETYEYKDLVNVYKYIFIQ